MNEDQKLPPYQRLKSILTEGDEPHLTDKASKNLDDLLGIKPSEPTFWDKVKSFFLKIDEKIFSKPSRKWNTYYHKRK
jgi:hypothetical protein